tara:strand:- start:5410 stop:5607 length:198 start_codon:yes stop_codon:yes gene_type:complete
MSAQNFVFKNPIKVTDKLIATIQNKLIDNGFFVELSDIITSPLEDDGLCYGCSVDYYVKLKGRKL